MAWFLRGNREAFVIVVNQCDGVRTVSWQWRWIRERHRCGEFFGAGFLSGPALGVGVLEHDHLRDSQFPGGGLQCANVWWRFLRGRANIFAFRLTAEKDSGIVSEPFLRQNIAPFDELAGSLEACR